MLIDEQVRKRKGRQKQIGKEKGGCPDLITARSEEKEKKLQREPRKEKNKARRERKKKWDQGKSRSPGPAISSEESVPHGRRVNESRMDVCHCE